MTREQAEAERDRLAAEQPEATWLVAERDGAWQVVKVGLPSSRPSGTALAATPRPSTPDSPPPPDKQIVNPNWGWI